MNNKKTNAAEGSATIIDVLTARMKTLQVADDFEESHMAADRLLCEALESLGCHDLVAAYREVGKWYA